uniref:DNA-repair protein Xrcc1 N-terminal domain-containing protein n=1 Tax=Globisporangium ultimum (strain ATCC 200006 / CBS 805.95 / DAOM BR144) TaxID=431595 RepID=K3XB97_GLOUD
MGCEQQHTERHASSSRRRRASTTSSAQSGVHHARETKISSSKGPPLKTVPMPAAKTQTKQLRTAKAPARRAVGTRAKVKTEDFGVGPVEFHVRHASGMASSCTTANLLEYSTKTWWQSYARTKETVVLALTSKTLLSEIRILNKNACAVDVSVAVENRPRSYVSVKRMQMMPHAREVSIKIGFIPCQFIRLEFMRHSHASIAVHGILPLGVPCHEIEDGSGPSLCNLLNHATENLLFGSSLRASQPFMDCLSDHRSGSPEWMARHRTHLLDEQIARLEAALFT